jgi:hypothetical protein
MLVVVNLLFLRRSPCFCASLHNWERNSAVSVEETQRDAPIPVSDSRGFNGMIYVDRY